MSKAKESSTSTLSYNQMLQRIEYLTNELRNPNGDVDNMIKNVEEAVELISKCRAILAETGIKVKTALELLQTTNKDNSSEV